MKKHKKQKHDPRYPLSHVRVVPINDCFVNLWEDQKFAEDFYGGSLPEGAIGVRVYGAKPGGSYFARRPDEKARRRRKSDNPPPPMSDLLGKVPE